MKRMLPQFRWKKCFLMLVISIVVGISILHGQSSSFGNIGVGGGISYGGIGARFTYMPNEILGLFGSLGYNLDELGYNVGAQFHVPSKKKLSVYITGMYGYNTVLIVDAIIMETKTTYFGFTTGLGCEFRLKEKSFLSAEVLLPFRPQSYKDAVDDLKSINYEIKEPLPLLFCIGYHFKF